MYALLLVVFGNITRWMHWHNLSTFLEPGRRADNLFICLLAILLALVYLNYVYVLLKYVLGCRTCTTSKFVMWFNIMWHIIEYRTIRIHYVRLNNIISRRLGGQKAIVMW